MERLSTHAAVAAEWRRRIHNFGPKNEVNKLATVCIGLERAVFWVSKKKHKDAEGNGHAINDAS